jgi:hypothetical protein
MAETGTGAGGETVSDPPLGWFVYSGPCEDELVFREFVPAPGFDEMVAVLTEELTGEIEEASRPCPCGRGSRIRRVLSAAGRYLRGDSR